jgi:polyphosphate kinase
VYRVQGPLQLSDLTALGERDPRPELRVEPLAPTTPPALREGESIFAAIRQQDIL